MAECVTKQQWMESYGKALADLRQQAKDGYDIEDALSDLNEMNARMMEGKFAEAGKVAGAHESKFESLTDSQIGEINKNTPKLASGKRIYIESGYRDSKGDINYRFKYKETDNKAYPIAEGLVYYDQINVREQLFNNDPLPRDVVRESYKQLEYDIWNDQDNALKLFDEMVRVDGVKDAHTEYLRQLLEDITDPAKKILNEFKVYLDREAKDNHGTATPYGRKPELILGIQDGSNVTGGMRATEVYLHEMLHMSVEVARKFKEGALADVTAEMRQLWVKAAKNIKAEDLVEDGDVKKAEEVYKYIFGNEEAGLSEFIAYAMTNEKFKSKLSEIEIGEKKTDVDTETVWGKVSALVIRTYEAIRDLVTKRDKTQGMDERIGNLVTKMWMLNNQTVENTGTLAKINNGLEFTTSTVDGAIIASVKKVTSITEATFGKVVDVAGSGFVGSALKVAGATISFANPYATQEQRDANNVVLNGYSKALEGNPLTGWLGYLLRPEGSIRTTLEYMKDDDDDITRVEKLGLLVKKIDAQREHVIEVVGKDIISKFKKLGHKEQTALTKALIETDAKTLLRDYGINAIADMMVDDKLVQEEIGKLETELDGMGLDLAGKKNAAGNYYKVQAKMLGEYMTTGEGSSALNVNAQDIVEMRHTKLEDKASSTKILNDNKVKLIELVDKLASLHAIANANASAKNRVGQLIKEHSDAVENMLMYHGMYEVENLIYKQRVGLAMPATKGEIKDLKSSYTEVRLAGGDEVTRKKMKKMGFTYVNESHADGVAVYKKWTSGIQGYDKQAVAKINEYKELQNLISITNTGSDDYQKTTKEAQEKVNNIHKNRLDALDNMLKGIAPAKDGMIPIVSRNGVITNFAVTMSRDTYENVTNQDKKAPVLLGKMIAEIGEKMTARRHNNDVYQVIERDMAKNYRRGELGENRKEYIEIGPDGQWSSKLEEKTARRIWKDMPQNMKDKIVRRQKEGKYIAIRKDMTYLYFGMRSPSILNMRIPFTDDTLEHTLNKNNLGVAVEGIKLAGDVWQEVVGLIKYNIVIKTPAIILANIVSNIYYSWSLGQLNPATGMVKAFKDTKEYMTLDKERIELELKRKKGGFTEGDAKRYKQVRILLKENPVRDLMEAGLFTSVASDTALVDLKSDTRVSAWIDKQTDKVPEIIKDAWSAVYVTEGTGLHNAMLMATAYSDFVARVNRYQWLVSKGTAKSVALKMITDEFVNYNRITGTTWTWLKEMGFTQFMPYFFGSLKSMIAKLRDKPSAMIMMSVATDIPNPSDALPGNTDLGYRFHDPFEIMFDQTPEFIMQPATLRFAGIL